jgi:hypothetical protein
MESLSAKGKDALKPVKIVLAKNRPIGLALHRKAISIGGVCGGY